MSNTTRRGGVVAGLLLATVFGAGAALAQDWQPEFEYGKLKPLPDGFPSEPITVVAAGDAESTAGLLARRLQEYSILYTPVKIEIEYRDPGKFGVWEALKYAADAEGGAEGYVNVIFATPDDILTLHTMPVESEAGVGLDDLAEVVTLEDHRYAVVQCKDAAWDPTWEALVAQIKDNPGSVSYAGGEMGSLSDVTFQTYLDAVGLGSLYDDGVIAYKEVGDTAARAQAVVACEADITFTDMDQLITQQLGDQVDVVLVSGNKRVSKFKEVPTASEAGIADDPMNTSMQVVVPASVDPLHVAWLNALWSKMGKDSYYKAGRVLDQVVNLSNVLDAEQSAALNDATDAKVSAATEKLGIGQ